MKWFKLSVVVALALGFFVGLDKQSSIEGTPIPPVGRLLNPFTGFWQNGARLDRLPRSIDVEGLHEPVTVVWDERRVPHIFAADDHDLYFAQGYVTARDRLWQMEFQTHAAAGRLAEIVGTAAIPLDRYRRRTGMVFAAERALTQAMADRETREALEAYSAGVNAWIDALSTKDLPLEYKILDYRPEEWTPLKCALLLKYMSWLLAGPGPDRSMTITRDLLGEEEVGKLFPLFRPFAAPIVPAGTPWTFEPLELPETPENRYWQGRIDGEVEDTEPEARGSNNWAVAGSKTRSGLPILANDMHLPLSLPSLWYEVQLQAPGVDVYGVTLPGAPTVIVGFNRDVAWGPTNSEADMVDFYHVTFNDDTRSEYLHDGQWKRVNWKTEVIRVRDRDSIIERVPYTRHGPVVYTGDQKPFGSRIPVDAAMRWSAHDPSNEVAAFHLLDRARNHDDYREALRSFQAPGQNFSYADRHGDIAIRHQGRFPLRWPGQGTYVLDGSDPAHDWQGWIPDDHVPHLYNPDDGIVVSANQDPVSPDYPYPMPGNHAPAYRARRIRELLGEMTGIDAERMVRMQSDVVSVYARELLPALIAMVEDEELDDGEREVIEELRGWNHEYRAGLTAPTIFDYWQRSVLELTWRDDIGDPDDGVRRPSRDVTAALILEQPDSRWFDDRTTPERESADDIALLALRDALDKLESMHGPRGERWRWGRVRGTDIRHIARTPGFGRRRLPTDGQYGLVRANTTTAGPAWQMVVALGPEVRAWGIYPGGQSGNPGSVHYDDFVDDWLAGTAYPLVFLESPDDPAAAELKKAVMR